MLEAIRQISEHVDADSVLSLGWMNTVMLHEYLWQSVDGCIDYGWRVGRCLFVSTDTRTHLRQIHCSGYIIALDNTHHLCHVDFCLCSMDLLRSSPCFPIKQ